MLISMKLIYSLVAVCFILGFIWGYSISAAYGVQGEVNLIPTWIKHIFAMYAQELISDAELINALTYLIQVGIIVL